MKRDRSMKVGTLLTLLFALFIFGKPASGVLLYGQLQNSDGTTPADADITFICYVSGTDDEIQTEDTITQNYSGGWWSVDTQNFTPNPPSTGDDFDMLFTNVVNGEAGSFSTTVPSEATNYGMITLAPSTNPAVPTGLTATPGPPGTVTLNWTPVGGITYRIYRHVINGGAYDRIAAGISGGTYVDTIVGELVIYYYIIVADDGVNPSGHSDEVNADSALPVELSSFTAQRRSNKIILEWTTQSEVNHLGWNIYRSENRKGPFIKVNQSLIKAKGQAASYQYIDENITPGQTYFYYLEDSSIFGEHHQSAIIRTTTGEMQFTTRERIKNALHQNYPNPFNPETWIPFELANPAEVTIHIYNTKGQPIRTLNLGNQKAGVYLTKDKAAYWDGRDNAGEKVASGVYFYTLRAGDFTTTRKMATLK